MGTYLDDGDVRLHHGDAAAILASLPAYSVDCVVTSPPYWGLRDYGVAEQIGLEETPAAYVERLVGVFREVRRVLAPHGTCWVNLGDSYTSGNSGERMVGINARMGRSEGARLSGAGDQRRKPHGPKPKDLVGIPWRVAFALQADGWWLRSDVIWAKPNPMPESVTDRPTKAHEYIFLLTREPRYWWDAEAVREASDHPHLNGHPQKISYHDASAMRNDGDRVAIRTAHRNVRSVWTIATQPTPEAHFATFPEALVERCLKAGCASEVCRTCGEPRRRVVEATGAVNERARVDVGDWIKNKGGNADGKRSLSGATYQLQRRATDRFTDCGHGDYRAGVCLDPFVGSGTVPLVARKLGLRAVGIDLSAEYLGIAAKRLQQLSLFAGVA